MLCREDVYKRQGKWYDSILPWFNSGDPDRIFILWDQGEEELNRFEEITFVQPDNPARHIPDYEGEVVEEKIENEKITFETTAIGVPHIIKISYFPNWKAIGAEGPFVISPSFMMVIPAPVSYTHLFTTSFSNKPIKGNSIAVVTALNAVCIFAICLGTLEPI